MTFVYNTAIIVMSQTKITIQVIKINPNIVYTNIILNPKLTIQLLFHSYFFL